MPRPGCDLLNGTQQIGPSAVRTAVLSQVSPPWDTKAVPCAVPWGKVIPTRYGAGRGITGNLGVYYPTPKSKSEGIVQLEVL